MNACNKTERPVVEETAALEGELFGIIYLLKFFPPQTLPSWDTISPNLIFRPELATPGNHHY